MVIQDLQSVCRALTQLIADNNRQAVASYDLIAQGRAKAFEEARTLVEMVVKKYTPQAPVYHLETPDA